MNWQRAQEWEREWWGMCVNTYGEEQKQLLYANRMGLRTFHDGKSPYNFDMGSASVLDIGGGPCSLLLKCINVIGKVVDPLEFPAWVSMRYQAAGIEFERAQGEHIEETGWDEAWLYNVLQHTEDPAQVIRNAQRAANLIRIFEWVDAPTNEGHPHSLTEAQLNEWLRGEGKIEQLIGQHTCMGTGYYGIFPTGRIIS